MREVFQQSRQSATFPFSPRELVPTSPPVNNPEAPLPTPTPRPYVPRVVDPLDPLAGREAKFQPRYVEVPALREHGFGRRNLAWGVLTMVLAIGLLVAAVYFSGQKAVLSMAACLFTFTALFVLSRLHIFRQRNGGFLAISVVVLLGALVPLADHGYERLAGRAQPAPPAATPAAPPAEVEPPLLKQSFALTNPDASQTQVRVLKDSRVVIGEKPFLIKVGDAFPLVEAKSGEVTFAVRDLRVSLPVAVVEILGGKSGQETRETAMAAALAAATGIEQARPAPAPPEVLPRPARPPAATSPAPAPPAPDLAAVTRSAQQEAVRRYPALGVKDSAENLAYITEYQSMKAAGNAEFFGNPEWPLELAEVLAVRNRWQRGDQPAPEVQKTPAQRLEPPMDDEDDNAVPVAEPVRPAQLLPPASEAARRPPVSRR